MLFPSHASPMSPHLLISSLLPFQLKAASGGKSKFKLLQSQITIVTTKGSSVRRSPDIHPFYHVQLQHLTPSLFVSGSQTWFGVEHVSLCRDSGAAAIPGLYV